MEFEESEVKEKIVSLFTYLKEMKKRLDDVITDQAKYDWRLDFSDLPSHPNVNVSFGGEVILKIARPNERKCPEPPDSLRKWLKGGWQSVYNTPEVIEARNVEDDQGQTQTIFFNEQSGLQEEFERWVRIREDWVFAETPSEEVRKIFNKLHELKGRIDKESERIEFFITNGLLETDSANGRIAHPLLMQVVGLEFDPKKDEPEFTIIRSDKDPFLYLEALRRANVNGNHLLSKREEFEKNPIAPDLVKDVEGFMKGLVHLFWQNGEYREAKQPILDEKKTYVTNRTSLILGKRNDSFFEQVDEYLEKISSLNELPIAFKNIVGAFDETPPPFASVAEEGGSRSNYSNGKYKYYLTKEYNQEQKRIIDALNSKGCVSVQGPPGTGKSHTIANLVGHLLAEGKRVLVSSYTTKALNVIREKVVEELRPLCVSVLDRGGENKKQLEESVSFINRIVLDSDPKSLESEIHAQLEKREDLEARIEKLKQEYVNAVYSEYRPIAYLNESVLPKEAAKFVAKQEGQLFVGQFLTDTPPLSNNDFNELLKLLKRVSVTDFETLNVEIPESNTLISPQELKRLDELIKENENQANSISPDLLQTLCSLPVDQVEKLKLENQELCSGLSKLEDKSRVLDVCLRGEEYREIINSSCTRLRNLLITIQGYKPLLFKHAPVLEVEHDPEELIVVLEKMAVSEVATPKFGLFDRLFKKEVKIIEENAKIQGRRPNAPEEFLSLVYHLKIKEDRKECLHVLEHEFFKKFGLSFSSLNNDEPELFVETLLSEMDSIFDLCNRISDFKKEIASQNINVGSAEVQFSKQRFEPEVREVELLKEILGMHLLPSLTVAKDRLDLNSSELLLEQNLSYLEKFEASSSITEAKRCLSSRDWKNYTILFQEIERLEGLKNAHAKLTSFVLNVSSANPELAKIIESREILDFEVSDFESIWKASYFSFKIDEYNSVNTSDLKKQIEQLKMSLRALTSSLVRNKAIYGQISRTTNKHRQALVAWLQLQNSLSKTGRGKMDAFKLRESKKLMKEAQGAVPVWIMPLSRILENFKLVDDSFDVLIIDEASQADLTNLPLLAICKKVIIVGDDKQVSPAAAGKSLDGLENLIVEFLGDIPGRANFHYKYSLFDVASASFGEKIPLVEHFRCVPGIIQFCNDLSYNGKIEVLRESSSSSLQPAIVHYYVENAEVKGGLNLLEAQTIVASIIAMTAMPEYQEKTFGVISLKGPKQHILIDQLLRENLSAQVIEKHKILSGKSPQFQGDERDVIILSLVDAPYGPNDVLTKVGETEDRKKELNVAISRARDQLFIYHSMSPTSQLKPDDLRLRLLKHAMEPNALMEKYAQTSQKAESHFEEQVHKDLTRAGYNFTAQYEVGAYRIDIVLMGPNGLRLALECDGEKWHSTEEQVRNDLERQAVLERLGFHFIRIRGSDYYRRKEKTLEKLFKDLEECGITPNFKLESTEMGSMLTPEFHQKIDAVMKELFLGEPENEIEEEIN